MTQDPHHLAGAPDAELARALVAAGRTLTYPDHDLADVVGRRLRPGSGHPGDEPRRSRASSGPRRRRGARRVLLVAGAALGLAAGTAAAAGLGLPGIALRASAPGAPDPGSAALAEDARFLGRRVSLPEARLQVAFAVAAPALPGLGEPAVYVADQPPGGRVSLHWAGGADGGPSLLLTQFRGELDASFFVKGVAPAAAPEPVTVAGSEGWWVEGRHEVSYRDADGRALTQVVRAASNVLLWTRDGVTYRLESDLSKARAVEIGASAR